MPTFLCMLMEESMKMTMVMCLSMKSSTMTVKRLKSPSFVVDHSLLDVVDIVASSGL